MSGKAERAAKRSRRLSTDSEDHEEEEFDWSERRQRPETAGSQPSRGRAASGTSTSRGRRNVSGTQSAPLAKVSRLLSSSPSSQQSLHLTVKLPSSKLRQATGMAPPARSSRPSIAVNSRDQFVGGEIIEGKRARNVKKSYVLESDSDDDEEDEEMEDVGDDDDAEGESVDEDEEDEEMVDQDAEGEDDDADGDEEIDIPPPPPPPTIKISRAEKGKKPTPTVKPTGKADSKTVETKGPAEPSDDEELSELESEVEEEEEEEEEEEGMQLGNEEDAEGEEEVEEVDEEEEEDDELDSDDETPAGGSRASTPDLTKLTKRQRARLEEGGSGHLLALPDEVQVKKHLTAEEHAMRRAEMARRRKNLSEKRNEEEKMETINKLLKKQAPKTNSRRNAFNGTAVADASPDGECPRPNPVFVRWVSGKDGNRIGVPEEWLEGPVGAIFTDPEGLKRGELIEEVQ